MKRSVRKSLLAAAVLILVGVAAGCAVPEDDNPRALDASQLPEDLLAPTETAEPTPLISEEVMIYLVDENNLLVPTVREVAQSAGASMVLETLFSAPSEADTELTLSSVLPADAVVLSVDVDNARDLVTVTLESEAFIERLEGENRQLAVAQLVFTATEATGTTGFSLWLNDNPVPLPTDSGESDPNIPVTRDDFRSVDPNQQETPAPSPTDEPPPGPSPTSTSTSTDELPPSSTPAPTPVFSGIRPF